MLAAKPAAKAAWNLAASASPVSMVKSVMLCAWVGGCRACVRGRVFRFRMRKNRRLEEGCRRKTRHSGLIL